MHHLEQFGNEILDHPKFALVAYLLGNALTYRHIVKVDPNLIDSPHPTLVDQDHPNFVPRLVEVGAFIFGTSGCHMLLLP